ncbi:hypothetical protein [Alkalihalobacterium alkalinitrilicum]|uniref:hypothetical protein n=1 Tax=Alkalihalobacterium alkalinitrilicum TaxID=427920 RepID=UPI000995B88E|nr:hypothetical protein [Alkalihalobacterium alkalinitrilicum]
MDYLVFLTLSYTGMRVDELARNWKKVYFDQHTTNTINYQLVTPKDEKNLSVPFVDPEVINQFKKHLFAKNKKNALS